jgi:hypothetical protein
MSEKNETEQAPTDSTITGWPDNIALVMHDAFFASAVATRRSFTPWPLLSPQEQEHWRFAASSVLVDLLPVLRESVADRQASQDGWTARQNGWMRSRIKELEAALHARTLDLAASSALLDAAGHDDQGHECTTEIPCAKCKLRDHYLPAYILDGEDMSREVRSLFLVEVDVEVDDFGVPGGHALSCRADEHSWDRPLIFLTLDEAESYIRRYVADNDYYGGCRVAEFAPVLRHDPLERCGSCNGWGHSEADCPHLDTPSADGH